VVRAFRVTPAVNTLVNLTDLMPRAGDQMSGNCVLLTNEGTVTVELGGSDLATVPGSRALKSGVAISLDLSPEDALYCYVRGGVTAGAVDVLVSR
jgi:hypothetical protein